MTSDVTVPGKAEAGDPEELDESSESFDKLLAAGGNERAATVLRRRGQQAADAGLDGYETVTTDYVNTIPLSQEPEFPGDEDVECSYRRLLRWNAAVMVPSGPASRCRGRRPHLHLPRPRLMPDFWQFPTVSMGIGPMNASRGRWSCVSRRCAQTHDLTKSWRPLMIAMAVAALVIGAVGTVGTVVVRSPPYGS